MWKVVLIVISVVVVVLGARQAAEPAGSAPLASGTTAGASPAGDSGTADTSAGGAGDNTGATEGDGDGADAGSGDTESEPTEDDGSEAAEPEPAADDEQPFDGDRKMPLKWSRVIVGGNGIPMENRGQHQAVMVNQKIFIFGGCSMSQCFNEFVILDTASRNDATGMPQMSWYRPLQDVTGYPPSKRQGHVMVVVDTKLFVFGGYCRETGRYLNDLYTFDTASFRWDKPTTSGITPLPRSEHTAVVFSSKIVVFGGAAEDVFFDDVNVLDVDKLRWYEETPGGTRPVKRRSHSATLVGVHMYVFAGFTGVVCQNSIDVLDLVHMNWFSPVNIAGQFPPAVQDGATILINNIIYWWGGCTYPDNTCFNNLYAFDTASHEWTKPAFSRNNSMAPIARGGHTLTQIGTRILLLGGCVDEMTCFSDLFSLETMPCPNRCSQHGSCSEGQCLCDKGWTDPDCGRPVEVRGACPNNCRDQGDCVQGHCECDEFFKGDDCSQLESLEDGCSPNDLPCLQERQKKLAEAIKKQDKRRSRRESERRKVANEKHKQEMVKLEDQLREVQKKNAKAMKKRGGGGGAEIRIENLARTGCCGAGFGGGGGGGGVKMCNGTNGPDCMEPPPQPPPPPKPLLEKGGRMRVVPMIKRNISVVIPLEEPTGVLRAKEDCPNDCNGLGVCREGKCACIKGWELGETKSCTVNTKKRIARELAAAKAARDKICKRGKCSGHGRCVMKVCVCYPGYDGEFCDNSTFWKSVETVRSRKVRVGRYTTLFLLALILLFLFFIVAGLLVDRFFDASVQKRRQMDDEIEEARRKELKKRKKALEDRVWRKWRNRSQHMRKFAQSNEEVAPTATTSTNPRQYANPDPLTEVPF